MRRKVGYGLAFVGGFLLMLGILASTYGSDKLLRTPIEVDSITNLDGTAELAGPDGVEEFPVKAQNVTHSNVDKSDDDVIVFANSTCLVRDENEVPPCVSADDPDNRLLSASTDDFATDRKTAMGVDDKKYLPSSAVPHEGLVNKWPFNVEKKDYDYWSGEAGEAVTATYEGTDDVEGIEAYQFQVNLTDVPIELTDGVNGFYSETSDLWIDPKTGSILKQVKKQDRVNEDGSPFLNLDLEYTDDTVKKNVDDAKSNTTKLNLLTETIPLIGYIVGIPLLLIGLAMIFLTKRRDEEMFGVSKRGGREGSPSQG